MTIESVAVEGRPGISPVLGRLNRSPLVLYDSPPGWVVPFGYDSQVGLPSLEKALNNVLKKLGTGNRRRLGFAPLA